MEPVALEPLAAGANSRVFQVWLPDGGRLVLKRYRTGPPDRLRTEFEALRFLWAEGIRCVPEPLASDPEEGIALYSLVPGRLLTPEEIGPGQVSEAADFLQALHRLAGRPGAGTQPRAAEACFSLGEHLDLVETRLRRLREVLDPSRGEAADFLDRSLAPCLRRVARRALGTSPDPSGTLPPAERTLTPSDFGFHNILLRPDGRLAFLDFEYFGWDDPAKTVADFFLQPQVPVPAALHPEFLARTAALLGQEATLPRRVAEVYPVLALKWCLIVLNVFRPDRPAGEEELRTHLERSRTLLQRLEAVLETEAFPLGPART